MQLTTENTKEFIEFWNNNKPEKFVHPMYEGIANVILDYLDQAEYQLTLEDNKVTVFDQQTNEELGEYTPEKLFWKARLLIESNDKGSRSSTNHYNNLLDIFSNKELSPKEYKEQIRDELQNYYLTNEYFNKNDELKWNSIDYTTKKWIEIENIYYEYEETNGFLSIGDSLTDLEEEYGENNFPEKAVEDGKLKIFDVYANDVEDYLRENYQLKDSEEINELLWDYEYQTKDVLKYYIPKIDNEQLKVLTNIVDSQNINLESLRNISFEDIYNKIDKSKLNEIQLEELNKIKEELSKPTVEIFKQSFDSFIMSLSEAASKSIQKDLENIKAKALYVFNVDNNEYTVVSKRDSENPFMIHKYYPENETGGLHHGSYDIDTYENAEKIAANRLINEQKEKYELINFIAGIREEEFNLELKNELSSVFDYLNNYLFGQKDQIELVDVKAYQYEGPSGKLKVLIEYKGNCREDDLFNFLHDEEVNGQNGYDYEINGYKIDLNPIKAEKSGTISEYLAMLKNIEENWPEVNKLINEQKENVMYKKIHTRDSDGVESWTEYDNKGKEIHYKDSEGVERWTDYDEKGNNIHFKDSYGYGYEVLHEYDEKGNLIHSKYSTGEEKWHEYDDKGNIIHYKDTDGYEQWREYDDKGNLIHSKDFDGDEFWYEYDEKGNQILYKDSRGYEEWQKYDYESNTIYCKDTDGHESWRENDDKGNEIHYKNSNGIERWKEYDDKGNVTHYKDNEGYEEWKDYDEKGNLIHFKDNEGVETWSTVEYVSKEQYLQEQTNLTQEEQEPQMYKKIHTKYSTGVEEWMEYNDKGNIIHFKDSDDIERWTDYDDKGNEIHYKNSNGFEQWHEYDNKGKNIHYKDSKGFECWYESDEKGNEIYYKNSNGVERWTHYDVKGNEIYFKNSEGEERWREYDDKGNEIHFKNSNGYEKWREYDDKGNVIHCKDSSGYEYWKEYDDKGNKIHFKDSEGKENWFEYDSNGNEIYYKESDGIDDIERWYEYDDKGNEIRFKDSDGYERWQEYDDKGNKIHCKDSDGDESWYEYDSNGNEIYFKDSDGFEKWTEYDEKGNQVYFKNSDGYEKWREYDDKGNLIHLKDSTGFEKSSTVEYVSKEQYLQEKIEQAKKDGYEAGYLFDNDKSIISWNKLKKIDGIFSDTNFIDVIDEIKESNINLSEKELKEEVVFRVLEDNVDWHGFDHSLIENEQIDSSKLLDTRCYILGQVSESVVENKINSLENIQNKIDELLLKDSRSKDYFIVDCIKSEIDQDFEFWQEIDCDPEGSVDNTVGSYQFLVGISDEVAKKLGLDLRNEDEELNYQYEILGTYEMIPEKFTKNGQPFIRFDNREIDFCRNISSDDESFMKQEIFSFDFNDSNYSFDILYKYFDKYVAAAMEQTQAYELFLNNPEVYAEKYVLENVKPMEIIEGISKEKSNTENDFRNMLFENMKTSKDPFEATFRIFEELKEKKNTEKIQRFNKYLEDNNCKTKEGFEKFFIEIIGLTKNEPQKKHKREFNGFHGIER